MPEVMGVHLVAQKPLRNNISRRIMPDGGLKRQRLLGF
jgi:hypothetical protein